MADRSRTNPADRGDGWFVDTTCFDCDVARLLAPGLIGADARGRSHFLRPPRTAAEETMAWRAILACPTGSIGAPAQSKPPTGVFPFEVAPGVHMTGYNSRDSFGATSWFVARDDGNILVDAPRFVPKLADAIEARGGIRHILLTHRDDVADYAKYAERFGAQVWIHRLENDAAPDATDLIDADADVAPGIRALVIPGHTEGSVAYHVDDAHLFTGDSLYWSRELDDLNAFRRATWFSWDTLADSLERLARTIRFEWVFPGHGGWGRADPERMHERLVALVARMRDGTVENVW